MKDDITLQEENNDGDHTFALLGFKTKRKQNKNLVIWMFGFSIYIRGHKKERNITSHGSSGDTLLLPASIYADDII
jgi:hypothetical protein